MECFLEKYTSCIYTQFICFIWNTVDKVLFSDIKFDSITRRILFFEFAGKVLYLEFDQIRRTEENITIVTIAWLCMKNNYLRWHWSNTILYGSFKYLNTFSLNRRAVSQVVKRIFGWLKYLKLRRKLGEYFLHSLGHTEF